MAQRFFLPIFLFFSHSVTVQSVIYELKGQQVQFDPDITGQPEQIMCRHNSKIIVEFNGYEEQVFGSYKGRLTLNQSSAQLQISDLRLQDCGKYDYEIYIGGKPFRQSYELEVIEKVVKPNTTCLMNNSSSYNVSAVLLCSVELNQTQSSLKFEWSSRGNVWYGPQLTIFLGGELDEEEYTCQVSNPRSNETATFRAKDCPKALTKKSDAGLSAGMITLIVLLILIVCLGSLILFCRRRHKRRMIKRPALRKPMNAKWHSGKPPTQTGSDQISIQNGGKRPKLEQPRPSSPLLGQQDTTEDPERQQREAKSHAESDFSNSPNMAPQDTHGEHNNDASADYKSDSSCQGKQDQSDNSPTQDIQQPTNPGPTGSEATQDEKDPNSSCVSD